MVLLCKNIHFMFEEDEDCVCVCLLIRVHVRDLSSRDHGKLLFTASKRAGCLCTLDVFLSG